MVELGYASKYSPVGWKATIPDTNGPVDLVGIAGDMLYEFQYDATERAYVVSKGSVKKITDSSIVVPGGGTFNTFLATWRHQGIANLKYTVNTVVYYNNLFSRGPTRRYDFIQSTSPPTVILSGTPTNLLHTSGASVAKYVCFEGNSIAVHSVNKNTGAFTCDHYSTSTNVGEYTKADYISIENLYDLGSSKRIFFDVSYTTYSVTLSASDFGGRLRIQNDRVIVSLDSSTLMRKIVRPVVRPLSVGTDRWKHQFCLEVGQTLHTLKTIPATWLYLDVPQTFSGGGPLTMAPSQYIGPYSLWTIRLGSYNKITKYEALNYYQTQNAYLLANADDESIRLYDSESYFDCPTEPFDDRPILNWNFYIPGYGPGQVTATGVRCHKDGIESDSSNVISGSATSSVVTPIKKFANVATYYSATATTLRTRMSIIMPDGIIYADSTNLYEGTHTIDKIPFKLKYPDGSVLPLSVVFTEVIDVSSQGLFDYSLIASGATIAMDENMLPVLL